MSIRVYRKDHLKEHAGVAVAVAIKVDAPESKDPLVFWTQHEKNPYEVNLHPFSTGQDQSNHKRGGGKKFKSFTGRPALIRQLAPAIEAALSFATKGTVRGYLNSLRDWWRVLDSVEASATENGQLMTRVDDVRLLTQIHKEFAHRGGMSRQAFCKFRSLADTTRISIGLRMTYWEAPEFPDAQKHIPPLEQRNALRFAVRATCRSVLDKWSHCELLSQSDTEPSTPKEAEVWRNVRYMRHIQKETGKVIPTPDDLLGEIPPWALNSIGTFKLPIRESVFPNHWDAQAIWHLCVLNTGWNPSTVTSLDVSKKFLFDHFKDDSNDPHRRYVLTPQTYELVGRKERAGGKEQFVTGQWKSLDGPGHLIKTYLERVEPLREVLKQQLALEKLKYREMALEDYQSLTDSFTQVKKLEQGVRSVWLYVNRSGEISWISDEFKASGFVNGEQVSYLSEITYLINAQRAADNVRRTKNGDGTVTTLSPVPHVAAKDFRIWFADYVYRASHGNILHVKKALNHSQLRTTLNYIDTNILNSESSNSARRFLNVLVSELDTGRVDLTILAHLYRYGEIAPEQQVLLASLRILPKSRMKIACKDALNPPPIVKATKDEPCDSQRCMLCLQNAVLLPESFDGIAMRVEELNALQGYLPIETWVEEMYDIELKNNVIALRRFDLNQVLAARAKWAKAIATGEHQVPGLPLASSFDLMELI